MKNFKFVEQQVIPYGIARSDRKNLFTQIELCGRVAYKSEAKITHNSALDFILRLKERGHTSVLEHSNIVLICDFSNPQHIIANIYNMVFGERSYFHRVWADDKAKQLYISGNLRAWLDTIQFLKESEILGSDFWYNYLSNALHSQLPEFFNGQQVDTDVLCETIQWAFLIDNEKSDLPIFIFKIICDRGISHEIVRHRSLSFTQESTRYVNYNNKLFEFILPNTLRCCVEDDQVSTLKMDNNQLIDWHRYETFADLTTVFYSNVLTSYSPQIARDFLPHFTKTELFVSGRWSAWKHFIKLRDSNKAHPRIQKIAKEIRCYFEDMGLTV